MDTNVKVVTLDWRMFGDFSAVGQLTKKIFSTEQGIKIYPLQCLDEDFSANLFIYRSSGELSNIFGKKIAHDAIINYLRKLDPGVIYVRLSPHKGVLELACKITAALPNIPLIVHYMDKPNFKEMSPTRAAYFQEMYRHLVLHAASVYTIHKSSLTWLHEEYGREGRVLANFIANESKPQLDLKALQERPINISYFGSIDRNMNSDSIAFFCRAVSNLPWVRLSIWSNSGIWGDIKKICSSSHNIKIYNSNLEDSAFKEKITESDLLLLPYNLDEQSQLFLKHSFSNKLIDYLEAGGVVLCLGTRAIPTVQSCYESGISLVCETESELLSTFASKQNLLNRLASLNLKKYTERIATLKGEQAKQLADFFKDIKTLPASASKKYTSKQVWTGNELQELKLAFLIRRKFFDLINGQQQSLSATLMSNIIKNNGYSGFDYEI